MRISLVRLFKGYYKYCECGCKELLPCINKRGKFVRFKKGHHFRTLKGEKHWKYNNNMDCIKPYIQIWKPDHPFCDKLGYIYEHRWIMEQYLGRYLTPKEVVHHKNRNGRDNRIQNLELFPSHSEHLKYEWSLNPKRISD